MIGRGGAPLLMIQIDRLTGRSTEFLTSRSGQCSCLRFHPSSPITRFISMICGVCNSVKAFEKSSNRVSSSRLFLETSPSASASKGFVIVGMRLTTPECVQWVGLDTRVFEGIDAILSCANRYVVQILLPVSAVGQSLRHSRHRPLKKLAFHHERDAR